jgi:hypothetical protein
MPTPYVLTEQHPNCSAIDHVKLATPKNKGPAVHIGTPQIGCDVLMCRHSD